MTDEEMKKYADEHWISVVFCYECKHMCLFTNPWGRRVIACGKLGVPVSKTFWCGYGERKK